MCLFKVKDSLYSQIDCVTIDKKQIYEKSNYCYILRPNWDFQLLFHFAFNYAVIIIKMFGFDVMSFGLAPCHSIAHFCHFMIFYYLFLGHDIPFLFKSYSVGWSFRNVSKFSLIVSSLYKPCH